MVLLAEISWVQPANNAMVIIIQLAGISLTGSLTDLFGSLIAKCS